MEETTLMPAPAKRGGPYGPIWEFYLFAFTLIFLFLWHLFIWNQGLPNDLSGFLVLAGSSIVYL